MNRLLICASLCTAVLIAACSDTNTTAPPATTDLYTISGKLRFDKGTTIPGNARVLVGWNVSSGSPDYIYVFGEGTVNMADSTFKVVFKEDPPTEALNSYGLGVGLIMLTSNQTFTARKYSEMAADSLLTQGFLGGAGNHAVIYIKGSPDSVARGRSWATRFQTGFNTGQGIRKDQGFDEFEKVEPSLIELIINDMSEIDWLNWT